MPSLSFLRKWYRPIQPSVRENASDIFYQEFSPSQTLSNYIYCYWELKTRQPRSESFSYRVVSDGCIDIFINALVPNENFIMGFCKKYTHFNLTNNFHYIGIRFLPSAIPNLFNIDASLLSNKTHWLKDILPHISIIFDKITGQDIKNFVALFNHIFINQLGKIDIDWDYRFYEALKYILHHNGNLETESLNTGLSPRQLRRIFNYYIGTTPKVFSKVVRFQYILNAKPSMQSLRHNKIFLDAGFYDQAHFIKDFKNFYGIKPSEAFRQSV